MPERIDRPAIRFDGQVVLVTGAGRGLGAAYARLLAARGASIVVHDAGVALDGAGFDPSVADGVVQQIIGDGGTAAACYENLEDGAACRRVVQFAVERFGRLDALIHNAGLVIFAGLEEMGSEIWLRMINLGVHAPFHLAGRGHACAAPECTGAPAGACGSRRRVLGVIGLRCVRRRPASRRRAVLGGAVERQ